MLPYCVKAQAFCLLETSTSLALRLPPQLMAAPCRPLLAVVSAGGVSVSALLEPLLGPESQQPHGAVWRIDTKYYSAEAEVEVRRSASAPPQRSRLRSSSRCRRAAP